MLEEIHQTSSRESVCKKNELLIKDGIEDWIAYLDGLETKVAIEYMDFRSDEIKVLLTLITLPLFQF